MRRPRPSADSEKASNLNEYSGSAADTARSKSRDGWGCRGEPRGGQREAWLQPPRKDRFVSNRIVSQGTNACAAG